VKFLKRFVYKFKRARYEKWAAEFAKKWDVSYAGILLLAGYRFTK